MKIYNIQRHDWSDNEYDAFAIAAKTKKSALQIAKAYDTTPNDSERDRWEREWNEAKIKEIGVAYDGEGILVGSFRHPSGTIVLKNPTEERIRLDNLYDALNTVINEYADNKRMLHDILEKQEGTFDSSKIRISDVEAEQTVNELKQVRSLIYDIQIGDFAYIRTRYNLEIEKQ